jgi:cytoskeletal protein CcmA (bactofilin family)
VNAPEITTILGKGSAFDGKLTFEGAVRIDGEFSGEIRTDGVLIIGESADVKADIEAATIVIEGSVRGDLSATESIQINSPAKVHGNLATPSLEIQKGSLFEGNCQMGGQQKPKVQAVPND